jgi:hypothetical protein
MSATSLLQYFGKFEKPMKNSGGFDMLRITPLIYKIGVQNGRRGQFSRHVTTTTIKEKREKVIDKRRVGVVLNLATGLAIRVVAHGEAKEKGKEYFPHIQEKYCCQIEAYKVMPDEEFFGS